MALHFFLMRQIHLPRFLISSYFMQLLFPSFIKSQSVRPWFCQSFRQYRSDTCCIHMLTMNNLCFSADGLPRTHSSQWHKQKQYMSFSVTSWHFYPHHPSLETRFKGFIEANLRSSPGVVSMSVCLPLPWSCSMATSISLVGSF